MKIIVNDEYDLDRIDKYLLNFVDISRSQLNKLFSKSQILVNDEVVKPSYLVSYNDEIKLDLTFDEINVIPEEMDIDVVYEDEYLLIVNKPSGLVVHPGNGNHNHTLVNGLMHLYKELSDINGEVRPGIVHRIDKDTSGLLVVAKTNISHEKLANMISNKEVKREYIALVHGEYNYKTATIDAPIGRDKNDRQKMTVTEVNSKSAVTHLTTIKKFKNYTLLKLKLETGRTHQIRVHLNYIGYPIVNDPVYSNDKCSEFGQFLHSETLSFIHPFTNKLIEVSVPLPKEMQDFIDNLEELI